MSGKVASRQDAWRSYWATGNLHSCVTSYDGNYSGAIAGFWVRAFAGLPEHSKVLDLATGNGAIPKLLYDLKGDSVSIDAVDATQIAPRWHSPIDHAKIHFRSGVWMERLPYADAAFECVCSQFGIEYAERPAAWLEALRVLKSDGQLHCVVHHQDSILTNIAAQEEAHCAWLVGDDGLLQAAIRLAPWLLRVRRGELPPQPGDDADNARMRFNQAQEGLANRIQKGGTLDLLLQARVQVQGILAHALDPMEALSQYGRQLSQAQLRCSELVQCAMTCDEVSALGDWIKSARANATLRVEELRQAEGLLAWGLSMTSD